jgi:hypothetical protein
MRRPDETRRQVKCGFEIVKSADNRAIAGPETLFAAWFCDCSSAEMMWGKTGLYPCVLS